MKGGDNTRDWVTWFHSPLNRLIELTLILLYNFHSLFSFCLSPNAWPMLLSTMTLIPQLSLAAMHTMYSLMGCALLTVNFTLHENREGWNWSEELFLWQENAKVSSLFHEKCIVSNNKMHPTRSSVMETEANKSTCCCGGRTVIIASLEFIVT